MLPYKISTLIYLRHEDGRLLLMQRAKSPNSGLWSPIGGKLEMALGESPFEAAAREVHEEIGLNVDTSDLHLFAMIAEKNYENRCHWLMFLFDCRKSLAQLPPDIDEGSFGFFSEGSLADLRVPETDRQALWPLYLHRRHGFTALRADCAEGNTLTLQVEQFTAGAGLNAQH